MVGPWGNLIRAVTKHATKKISKTVDKQVRADVTRANHSVKVSHKSDYTDLDTDSRLSPEWIDGLIDRSKKPEHLKQITQYITNDEKTANLMPSSKRFLLKKLAVKVDNLHTQAQVKFDTTLDDLTEVMEHLTDFLNIL